MKNRIFSLFFALVLVFSAFTATVPISAYAADGGEGNLSITSHSDNETVYGDRDVTVRWSKVSGAAFYHLTVKDTVSGARPYDEHVSGTSVTIPASSAFLVDGRTYKLYACAMDANGNVLNNASDWEAVYVVCALSEEEPEEDNSPELIYDSPAPTSDPVISGNSGIIIGGVDIGYGEGDYFTKNGKACGCHSKSSVDCVACGSDCNCLRYPTVNGKKIDLLAVQCFGYARYCQYVLYGKHDGSNSSDFTKLLKGDTSLTASELKNALLNAPAAAHIRTSGSKKGYAHSVTVVSANADGVVITDCNYTGACKIDTRTLTWSQLASFVNGYGGVNYVSVYNGAAEIPTVPQPAPDTALTVTLGNVQAKSGETVKLPIYFTTQNGGVSYLRAKITCSLDYTVTNASDFTLHTGSSSVIWYASSDLSGNGALLGYVEITVPENAASGTSYTVTVQLTEANNADEESINEIQGDSGTVTVENRLRGDVNGDGAVDGKDLTRLLRYIADYDDIAGTSSVSVDTAGDLNGDGKIDGKDVTAILKILSEI